MLQILIGRAALSYCTRLTGSRRNHSKETQFNCKAEEGLAVPPTHFPERERDKSRATIIK
eukprot:287490-Amphidinium_carterae.1